jgi:glucosyl-dolichyl phosphate glucuronosyltransferase
MGCDISIVLCTYNRAGMLGDSLRSWSQVVQRGRKVEFIVVDNASTDATRSVVEGFVAGFPGPLRYVHEKQAGLSFARNRGIEVAAGRIVAFVDDDIYFDAAWLEEILAAFDNNPDIHCVGGKSIPNFEGEKPDWLTESMLQFYGSTLSGDSDRLMVFPEHPFGVNMAFRREVIDTVGRFRTDLGRVKNSLLSNEEKDMFHRVNAAGYRVWYASRAVLQHRVPVDRLQQGWLLKRAYWQGISNVIFDRSSRSPSRWDLCKHLLRSFRRLVRDPDGRKPRKITGYHKGYNFESRMRVYRQLGVVRQDFVELFRRSSQS